MTEQTQSRTAEWTDPSHISPEHVAVGVCTLNLGGCCTHINEAALRMLHLVREDAVGRSMHSFLHGLDSSKHAEEHCPLALAAAHGQDVDGMEEVFLRKDGSTVQMWCSVTPIWSESGPLSGAVLTMTDVSWRTEAERQLGRIELEQREVIRQRDAAARVEQELAQEMVRGEASRYRETSLTVERIAAQQLREQQRAAEERLVQSEKLAAVGRLSASISHEINNPLEAVTNLLYLLRTDSTLSEESMEYLRLAQAELARASEIVSQTLRFQRGTATVRQCAPEALIDSVLALHQGRLHHSDIRIVRQHRSSATLACAEGDLRQILNNLLTNALDAMRDHGGTLVIRTSPAHDPGSGVRGIRVTVADSGSGMSRTTAAKIFEAFYTTKGASGSGLGLWISSTLTQRNGGRLSVRSNNTEGPWRGTTFSVFIPDARPETLQ